VDLSIIIPTLLRVNTALLIARRMSELLESELAYEVVIVTPQEPEGRADERIRFVSDNGGGVYAAYWRGLREARGEYVWFVGDDDYPLDSLRSFLSTIKARNADLIVAPVIYSSGRLYKPRRSRLGLLFYNWCQQGILYRRNLLLQMRFYKRLNVQADHYVNVVLRGNQELTIEYSDQPLCVFGAHGISSLGGDQSFRQLRPRLARRILPTLEFWLFLSIVKASDSYKFILRFLR
jgi:glycosyltransferase involved in cell wall biosynthesis